jgi:PAS domain S-box-containing protein
LAGIRLFGHTRRGMLGNNINMIVPEPLGSAHQQYLEKYIETGQRVCVVRSVTRRPLIVIVSVAD